VAYCVIVRVIVRVEAMPVFTHNDVQLNYERRGRLQSGQDQPVLFLSYCLGGNLSMWGPEIDILAERLPVVLWDPRGHGGTSSPAHFSDYGVNRSAEDLSRLMDCLGCEKAVVGGVSMGGGIAACFAGRFPERTTAVVIADSNTAAGLPVAEKVAEVRRNTIDLCERDSDVDMASVAKYFIEQSPVYRLYAGKTEQNERRVNRMVASMNPVGFANTLRSMLKAETRTEDLLNIRSPAMVMAGDSDPAMAAIELTARTVSHCEFAKLADAGHLSNIDQPELFAEALVGFMERANLI